MDEKQNIIIGRRLKQLRLAKKLEQQDVAKHMGYKSDSTISKWENGKNLPNGGKLTKLAILFDTTTDYILHGNETTTPTTLTEITNTSAKLDEPRQQNVLHYAQEQLAEQNKILKFPDNDTVQETLEPYTVHGTGGAAAGRGYSYTDYEFETFYTDIEPPRHDFATPIHGDSMQPYYNNGDVAYIQLSPYIGTDDYIVDYNGQSFIKQVKRNGDTFILRSYNEAYEDIIITREEVESKHIYFNIIGKVIGSFTPIEK